MKPHGDRKGASGKKCFSSIRACVLLVHGRARARQKRQGRATKERKRKKEAERSKEKGTKQGGTEKKKEKIQLRKEKTLQGKDREKIIEKIISLLERIKPNKPAMLFISAF